MRYADPVQMEIKNFRELIKLTNIDLHPHYYSNLLKSAKAILSTENIKIINLKFADVYLRIGLKSLVELEYYLFNIPDYNSYFKVEDEVLAVYEDRTVYTNKKITKFDIISQMEEVITLMIDLVNEKQKLIPLIPMDV